MSESEKKEPKLEIKEHLIFLLHKCADIHGVLFLILLTFFITYLVTENSEKVRLLEAAANSKLALIIGVVIGIIACGSFFTRVGYLHQRIKALENENNDLRRHCISLQGKLSGKPVEVEQLSLPIQ